MDKEYAYVDGSYNSDLNICGYGGFLVDQVGKRHILQGVSTDPKYTCMRNVGGEILGAVAALKKAKRLEMKSLTLFYDYEGIANWPLGRWKTNLPQTSKYASFVKQVISGGLYVIFQHVKGHTGVEGNEEADRLAKEAISHYVDRRSK